MQSFDIARIYTARQFAYRFAVQNSVHAEAVYPKSRTISRVSCICGFIAERWWYGRPRSEWDQGSRLPIQVKTRIYEDRRTWCITFVCSLDPWVSTLGLIPANNMFVFGIQSAMLIFEACAWRHDHWWMGKLSQQTEEVECLLFGLEIWNSLNSATAIANLTISEFRNGRANCSIVIYDRWLTVSTRVSFS